MKARTLRLLTLPLLFGMTACDYETGTYFICITQNTDTSINKSYEKFTGKSTFNREFKTDRTLSLTVTTKSGNLIVKISSKDGDKVYCDENLDKDFTFSETVPSGKYVLYVEGNEHSGSYKFEW